MIIVVHCTHVANFVDFIISRGLGARNKGVTLKKLYNNKLNVITININKIK